MSLTADEANALIDVMIGRADDLRRAGILSVSLGGSSFTLAPAEHAPDDNDSNTQPDDGPHDVLHDEWAFGRPANPAEPKTLPRRSRTPL